MNQEHYIKMATTNLLQAKEELNNLLNNLNKYVNINNTTLYNDEVKIITDSINAQIDIINHYITPNINAIEKGDNNDKF